jgi:hypothetical protein
MINSIAGFYKKHKVKLIILLIAFVVIMLVVQLLLFFNENIEEKDMAFESISWSEACDGTVYTPEQKADFCQKCLAAKGKAEDAGEACLWPLDMYLHIGKVEVTKSTGGEVHCYIIIDGVNYYTEKGRYFGLDNSSLFNWERLDASKSHKVEFCCGINRESALTTILNLEKQWPQACVTEEVGPRCY